MPYLQATLIRKSTRSNLREDVHTVESMDTKQLIAPIRKAIRSRVSRGKPIRKRNTVLKESRRERDIMICPKLHATIVENMAIMHMTVQNHMIMLILPEKMSETRDSRI